MIAWFLSQFWPYIAAGFAAVAVMFQQRHAGAKAERAKQAERDAKARSIADDIDDAVAGRSPEANRKELGKWSPKP